MSGDLGKQLLDEFAELDQERKLWEDHWQLLGELVHGTKQNFTTENAPGERLSDQRYDSTAVFANQTLASSLIGMLWPNGAKSMRILPSSIEISETQENKDYFDKATEIMIQEMDNPEAGLVTALDEYMLDQGAFGFSGIGVFKNLDPISGNALRFEAWGAMQLYIAEGRNARVDTIFRKFKWTLRRAISTYGIENLSKKLQDRANNTKNLSEKIDIIHAIRPRTNRDPLKKGNRNMPIMSVHLEFDGGHVIRESGFPEIPVKVTP